MGIVVDGVFNGRERRDGGEEGGGGVQWNSSYSGMLWIVFIVS